LYITGNPKDFIKTVNISHPSFSGGNVNSSSLTEIIDQSIVTPMRQEMEDGSITPTTFCARGLAQKETSPYFLDTYSYGQNSVIRFGLNVHY